MFGNAVPASTGAIIVNPGAGKEVVGRSRSIWDSMVRVVESPAFALKPLVGRERPFLKPQGRFPDGNRPCVC